MSTFEVIAVRLGFICPECMGAVPLNALDSRVLCGHCQSSLDASKQLQWLGKVFGFWGRPEHWKRKLQTNSTVGGNHFEGDVRLAVCRSCAAPLDCEDVTAAISASTAVACRGCGELTPVRIADDAARKILPAVQTILGEAVTGHGAETPVQAVLCACLQCGGGLAVDGTKRLVTCAYCKSTNFISDALWLRMHPAQKRQWLYLRWDPTAAWPTDSSVTRS